MTRLDTSNDASMEDILASIRKIIAEDPPGSRPATPASTNAAPAATNASMSAAPLSTQGFGPLSQPAATERAAPLSDPGAFMSRESFVKSSAPRAVADEPAIQAPAASEPYLRSEPQKSTLARAADAFAFGGGANASAKVDPVLPMPSARDTAMGDFIPKSRPADPFLDRLGSAPAATPANAPAAAPAVTLDAQLTELLGGTLPSARPGVVGLDDVAAVPAKSGAATGAEAVFSATRVSFGGEPAIASPVAAPAAAPVEADPFSFDIGPSPFAAREAAAPEPVFTPPAAAPEPVAVSTVSEPEVAAAPAPVAAPMPAPMPAYEPAPVMRYIAPSVSATVAPALFTPLNSAPEPVAAIIEAKPVAASPAPAAPAVEEAVWTPVADVAKGGAVPAVAASVAPAATALATHNSIGAEAPEAAQGSALDAAFEKMGSGRSVEDTVADLLRPMLKTWLAENMPRIIERALRRELLDARTPDHKSAAE